VEQKIDWQMPGTGKKENEELYNVYRVSFWKDENFLDMDGGR
jgi:hypothetical protein